MDDNLECRMDRMLDTQCFPLYSHTFSIVKYLRTLIHFVWDNIVEQICKLKLTDAELCLLRILCLLSGGELLVV